MPRISDLYYQQTGDSPSGAAAWGIGLAVSKAIVEAHCGRLTVASLGRNRRATFALELETLGVENAGQENEVSIHSIQRRR